MARGARRPHPGAGAGRRAARRNLYNARQPYENRLTAASSLAIAGANLAGAGIAEEEVLRGAEGPAGATTRRQMAAAYGAAAATATSLARGTCPGWTGSRHAGSRAEAMWSVGATIVMLTAAHGDSVEADAEQAGADLFLTKPFSPLDLLRLVDQLGERQARRASGSPILDCRAQ